MYITDTIPALCTIMTVERPDSSLEIKEHVVPIRIYLKEAVFDPEVISIMTTAFEDVCKTLDVSGRSDVTKEMIAATIIQLARRGETDPVALSEKALSKLRLS